MTDLRILEVIPSVHPRAGGTAEAVRQVVRARAAKVARQTVVSLDDPITPLPPIDGAELIRLGPGAGFYGYIRGLVPRLRELAQSHDVVVVNGLWQYHGRATLRALLHGTVPWVIWPHGMLDPWFSRGHPLKHLKKLCYWHLTEARLIAHAAATCFTTECERTLARETFPSYRPREAVLGFGILPPPPASDAQRAAFLVLVPQAQGRRVLLFLGRLHGKKGVDLLTAAYAEYAQREPTTLLVMAGPDPDGWQQRLAASCPPGQVVWPGMLTGDAKWGALRAAEAFCLVSHQENFGIAVVEALACGTPVLISDQVNIHAEVVIDGAGLANKDTSDGARRLLGDWFALSQTRRDAMREHALACWKRRYQLDDIIDGHLECYRRLINDWRPPQWQRGNTKSH